MSQSSVRAKLPVSGWMRGVFLANLVAQSAIIVTGAVVRLTGSGLGCPTWPECVDGSYVPVARQAQAWHKYVEFGNRTLTFLLGIIAIATLVAGVAYALQRRRAGLDQRPALTWLAAVPFLGTVAQALLGGITVLTGLNPATVGLHFLLSMVLVAAAVALVVRSRDADDAPLARTTIAPVRMYSWVLLAVTAVVVLLGVVTTGSGPHSGDAESENRFPFDPRIVSWLHADVVLLFTGLLIGFLVLIHLVPCAASTRRVAWIVLGIAVVQATIGYTQYFAGLPIVEVTFHVVGAVVLWIAILFLPGTLRTRGVLTSS